MALATTNPPAEALARLIDRHGARTVLAALVAALTARAVVRRPARLDASALNDHLRRDIGLPPHAPAPRHWEIR